MDELHGLCGNSDKYKKIQEWIRLQLDNNDKFLSYNNVLFVAGDSGIGKTHSIKHICKVMDLHTVYLSTHNCWSAEELQDLLIKHTTSSMIQILSDDKKEKVIVIDDFESMMTIDRTINTTLLNILTNLKLKKVPIICIASTDIVKKIGMLKKKCLIIELAKPSDTDMFDIFKNYKISHDKLETIIKNSAGNISQCLNMLHSSGDTMDTNIKVEDLYSVEFNRERIRKIIMTDPWLIPLRFHENLISELKNKKLACTKSKGLYKKFMYDLLYFDLLIHNNCLEHACDYFASIIYFLYMIPYKKKAISNLHGFTKILSYLSLQKKYCKKTYSLNFPLYQIGNYHTNIVGRNFMFFN